MTSHPHKHILLAGREWCMRDNGCCLVESNDQATMTELIGKEQKQQAQENKETIVTARNPKLATELRELLSLMLTARSKNCINVQMNTSETKIGSEKSIIREEDADSKGSEMEIDSGVDGQLDVASDRSYERIHTHNAISSALISSDPSNPSSGTQPDEKLLSVEQVKVAKNNLISSNAKQVEVTRTNVSAAQSNMLRANTSMNPVVIQGMPTYPLNPLPPHIAGVVTPNTSGQMVSPPLHPPGYASHPWESIQPHRVAQNQQTGQIPSYYNPAVPQEPTIYPYGIQFQYVGNNFALPSGQWSQPYTYGGHPPYQWTHPHDTRNSSTVIDSQWNTTQASWFKRNNQK